MRRILFAIFLIFFLTSLSLVFPTTALATKAVLSCSPATGTFKVGETLTVDYVLDTRNFQAFGAEVVATFDTSLLEVVGTQSTPVTGTTKWSEPTTNTIDTATGKIDLDFGKTQPAFVGNTTIGQVTFKAKASGQPQLNYTFFQQYDDTTPGVAKVWGKKDGVNLSNILTDVANCIYVIEGGITPVPSPTPLPTLPPIGGPTSLPTVAELPRAGNGEVTFSLLSFGFLLLLLGIFLPQTLALKD